MILGTYKEKAKAYNKGRAGYDLVCEFLHKLGRHAKELHVLDLGAGTGKLGMEFQKMGASVVYAEPDADMREQLLHNLMTLHVGKSHVVNHFADNLENLKSQSFDLVVAGNAAHWFNHLIAKQEILRVLKLDGKLALFSVSPMQDTKIIQSLDLLCLKIIPFIYAEAKKTGGGGFVKEKKQNACGLAESFFEKQEGSIFIIKNSDYDWIGFKHFLESFSFFPDLIQHKDVAIEVQDFFTCQKNENDILTIVWGESVIFGLPKKISS